jgi:hypothetical protein
MLPTKMLSFQPLCDLGKLQTFLGTHFNLNGHFPLASAKMSCRVTSGMKFLGKGSIGLSTVDTNINVGFWCQVIHKKFLQIFDTSFEINDGENIYH